MQSICSFQLRNKHTFMKHVPFTWTSCRNGTIRVFRYKFHFVFACFNKVLQAESFQSVLMEAVGWVETVNQKKETKSLFETSIDTKKILRSMCVSNSYLCLTPLWLKCTLRGLLFVPFKTSKRTSMLLWMDLCWRINQFVHSEGTHNTFCALRSVKE